METAPEDVCEAITPERPTGRGANEGVCYQLTALGAQVGQTLRTIGPGETGYVDRQRRR